MVDLISQIPPTLNATYEKILEKSQSPKDVRRILHIIIGAVRPLSLAEMNIAFVIKRENRDYEKLDPEPAIEITIRNLCGLFVRVIKLEVYLVHQTARDFLIKTNNPCVTDSTAWQNSLDPFESETVLTQICTSYLMLKVLEEQPLLVDHRNHDPKMARRYPRDLAKHDFLAYAAINWAAHFRKVQSGAASVVVESVLAICDTQSKRFHTWFEIFARFENLFPDFAFEQFPEYSSLHIASVCGCETIVNHLDKGADVDARTSYNETSLMLAISKRHHAVVKLLLDQGLDMGAKVKTFEENDETILHLAVDKKPDDVVRLLENNRHFEVRDHYGYTALHTAIFNKDESSRTRRGS